MPQTIPLDQVYELLRQPITPQIEPHIYAEEVEKEKVASVTSDWFRQVAGELNTFADTRKKQVDAYEQRALANRQEATQAGQQAGQQIDQQNALLLQRDRLLKQQQELEQAAATTDLQAPVDTPVEESLVEEASGNSGFFGGLKDIATGAADVVEGAFGTVGGPVKDLFETPVEVGRELVTGGGLGGVKRELHEGVAGFTEPLEAAFEIAREAIRGDLQGLSREIKEAGREIPEAAALIKAWGGMNKMFLGEQKIITPLTRPIIRETLQAFHVPDGVSETIAKYVAEVLVPTTFIPIYGQLGKTKGAVKLLKAGMAEGTINMLQNRAGRKERGEEDPSIIEDATMFTFGLGGRVGMEYAARGLSKFIASRGGKAVGETVDDIPLGKAADDAAEPVKYYHATDPESGNSITSNGFRSGETQFLTTDPDLAYQFALRKTDNPVVIEVSVREGAELGGKDAIRTANPEDLTAVRTLNSDEIIPLEVKPKGKAPDDDVLELEHYSSQELDEIDPSFAGTGKAGDEAKVGGPRVSSFYTKGSPPEKMIEGLPNKMRVSVKASTVLDLMSDEGQEVVARARALKEDGVAVNLGDFRQQALDEGWKGVRNSEDPLNRVQMMETTKVTKDTPKGRIPNEEIRTQASEYSKQAGLPELSDLPYAKVDEPRATRIADAYEEAVHSPNDPKVKAAYEAFKQETLEQWNYLKAKGIKFDAWTKEGQPYANSAEMRADVADNKHLSFYQGGEMPADHPMAAKIPGSDLSYNDTFRAVHDYFGHAKEGFEFGPRGEENAWRTHSQMFGDEARKAMTSETRGQNSWVNFGPEGKANRADPTNTVFAEQKATLLDDEFTETVRPESKPGGLDESFEVEVKTPADMVDELDTPSIGKLLGSESGSVVLSAWKPIDVRTIVTSTKKQIGSAAHSFVTETKKVIVRIARAIQKMGRTFNSNELGQMRIGKQANIEGIAYKDVMNVGASRRWLHPEETWKEWSQFMSKRVGGKSDYWLSTAKKDVREYTEHQMGLIGEGPIGGGVKIGGKTTERFGPPTHPRTYEELTELVEEGSHLRSSTGEILDMKRWYNDFHKFMKTTFGDDAEIMTMFAAATQANQSPAGGVAGALRAFTDWKLGMPISGQSSSTIRKSMENIIRGGVPTGPNINPIWEALRFSGERGRNAVAVDRWMFGAIGAAQNRWKNLASNDHFMRFAQTIIREAANEAGMPPRSFQAAVWGGTKMNWNKVREAAGQKVLGEDFRFFEDLFKARMADHGMRSPTDFKKLALQAELFDVEALERAAIDGLEIAKAGETPVQRSARVTDLMYSEWNEKVAASSLLETGEIPEQITSVAARDEVAHKASMYKRDFSDRLMSSDMSILETMSKKGRLPQWQKTILDETIETRKVTNAAPEERLASLPKEERVRLNELGYDHVPQTVEDLKRVHTEMLALDKVKTVPELTKWLKRNTDIVGDPQEYIGRSIPTGKTYTSPLGTFEKHVMSPYWEPRPFYETGRRLNIPRIKSVIKAQYPDQRIADGTNQTIGDALRINDKSPVGACA